MRTFLIAFCASLAVVGCATTQAAQPPSPLARLHDDLHLTPDQEPLWTQYAEAMSNASEIEGRREAAEQMLPQLTTPRRLALMEAAMADELNDFHHQIQATNALYDRLTPEQQRTFDRETLPPDDDDGP